MKKYNLRLKYGTFPKDGDNDGWRDTLSDELAGDKGLADFKDLNGLAKAYLDTKADVGRSIRIPGPDADAEAFTAFDASLAEKVPNMVRLPGDETSAEDSAAFYARIGKPTEASKYVPPENLPDNLKENMNALAEMAFANNLTQGQFKGVADKMMADHKLRGDTKATFNQAEFDKLKLDWGMSLNSKSHNILALLQQTDAPQAMIDAVTEKGTNADTMKWLDSMVTALSGDGGQMTFQGQQGDPDRVTPDEAKTQINEIMNKKEYWDAASPQQAGLVKKVIELQKAALAA